MDDVKGLVKAHFLETDVDWRSRPKATDRTVSVCMSYPSADTRSWCEPKATSGRSRGVRPTNFWSRKTDAPAMSLSTANRPGGRASRALILAVTPGTMCMSVPEGLISRTLDTQVVSARTQTLDQAWRRPERRAVECDGGARHVGRDVESARGEGAGMRRRRRGRCLGA